MASSPRGDSRRLSFSGGYDVAYYRLYVLSGPQGRFIGFEEFEANDDVEAVHRSHGFLGPHPLELWCGKRKVRAFPAPEAPGEASSDGVPA